MIPTETAVDADTLAIRLGVSRKTIHSMARNGTIPGFKVNSMWRFYITQVDQKLSQPVDPWMQSNRARAQRRRRT